MKQLLKYALILVLIFSSASQLLAQKSEKKQNNYGNAPDELIPYNKFQKAYINFFAEPQDFTGAGREKPEPDNLDEVRIGFLGPLEGSELVSYGIQMLQGCKLAVEEANEEGGYKGIPFKIMEHNDIGLWGAAANKVVEMYDQNVWAFLGSIDDINTHVALRTALKVELPMVNSGDPDPTITETRIPWLLHTISDDRQSCYALSDHIYNKAGLSRIAIIRVDNRYGRVGTKEFKEASQRLGHPFILEVRFNNGDIDFTKQINRIKNSNPDGILIWGNPQESALIVNQIREMGIDVPLFASDRTVSPVFTEIAGENAEGLVTTCQYNPKSKEPKFLAFKKRYKERFEMEADVFAAHAFDGMNIIIESIRKAGLNRYLIRDLLTDMKTFQGYEGVTGKLIIDSAFNDVGTIYMARLNDGDFEFYPSPLEVPNIEKKKQAGVKLINDTKMGICKITNPQ